MALNMAAAMSWGLQLASWHNMLLLLVIIGIALLGFWMLYESQAPKLAANVGKQVAPKGDTRPTKAMSLEKIENLMRSLGAPTMVHEEGCMVPSHGVLMCGNSPEATPFENELCIGSFYSLHRATHDRALNRSGDYPGGQYFKDKTRLWEARVQLNFKVPPTVDDLFFGVEMPDYVPVAGAAKPTMEVVVRALKGVVGQQVYHSVGDDPKITQGSCERPTFKMPMWAFDQYIVTPEGQTPPKLTDPAIPSMGQKRAKRVSEYRKGLEELTFTVGPTYTFCFWGISKWLDKVNWALRLPLNPIPLSLNLFAGSPPVHVCMYTLKPSQAGDERHLQERKNYYFNVAFWSSKHRPSFEKLDNYLQLTDYDQQLQLTGGGDATPLRKWSLDRPGKRPSLDNGGFSSWLVHAVENRISCCVPFISSHK